MIETRIDSGNADILIIAEGTYPFVLGGVAAWIYDIIEKMPDFNFGVIFLGAYQGLYNENVYPIPANLTQLQLVYLFDEKRHEEGSYKVVNNNQAFDEMYKMHEVFKQSHSCPHGLIEPVVDIGKVIQPLTGYDNTQFLHNEMTWNYITEQYTKHSTDPSFVNYFWNIRNMHMPLWRLEEALRNTPKAKVVHTISTGYAGLLASMIHQRYGYPLILSEHGLYTKERNIELLHSTMFAEPDRLLADLKSFTYQHQLWLNFFDSLARICYNYADLIVSLYSSAQKQQVFAGADISKTRVIANGVDIPKFAALRRPISCPTPKIVCFVGRFVRIKDIKTFIRAVAIMFEKDDSIVAWIKTVGKGDSEYFQECKDYIDLLGLNNKIKFIIEGDMFDILAQIGLLILTSISEGMPLVLLESLAAGIPVIATDVGACREIIEGFNEEDRSQGKCGEIVSISNAVMLADAAVKFLNDRSLWLAAQQTGIQRVEKYYNQTVLIDTYRKIYQKAIKKWPE